MKVVKWLLFCGWSWVLLASMGSGRSMMGCLEEERTALLNIKAAFNPPNSSDISEWGQGNGDCCDWNFVGCDDTTSRVNRLILAGERRRGLPWVIDATLFLPLEELQYLDLSFNSLSDINGTLHLKKLKMLDLSYNYLRRVPSLDKETSEKAPNLSSNQLEGVNLEILDLAGNNLVDAALADIARITSLKILCINNCGLNASSNLLEGFCGLRNVEALNIAGNGFWDPLPSCIGNLTSLRDLDVSNNNFNGAIPSSMGDLTSLRSLTAVHSNFNGPIPSSLFPNLTSLEFIALSGNAFEGTLSLASLANISNLTEFHLRDNRNRLEVNTEKPTWFPSFQLKSFSLSDCVLNKDANSVIPSFLEKQYVLIDLYLNHNGITGYIPKWILGNKTYLVSLDIKGNHLSSAFHLPSNWTLVNMEYFDASANGLDEELPPWIASMLPNVINLNLSGNLLKGRIPSSMGNMDQLRVLDLSNNGFTGEIPETLATNCTFIYILKLSGNNLQGYMLPRNSNLTSLEFLYLEDNRFSGNISPGILNSFSLQVLDVSNNSLSGILPNWIGDIQYLKVLTLSSNLLGGPLPLSFCNLRYLLLLDLSGNNLGPSIPPCANVTVMRFLHLTNDTLSGHFPDFLSRASSIVTLDLRSNALSGEVPNWIGSLRNLKVLLLQGNNFERSIPLNLCLLKNMSILDLSDNNLSGIIPSCLKDLTFGNNRAPTKLAPLGDWGMDHDDEISVSMFGLEEINFVTKDRLESYKGNILKLMSGLDLSRNNLTGNIPPEIGYLSELRALNLSHNLLVGPIPETFSNLKNVESFDLSYNNLSGLIPSQLIELYALSTFRVGHNNLSGRTPDRKNQFGTFDEASYEGNPLLCGTPLKSCYDSKTPPFSNHTRDDDSWREAFFWSFAGSYVVAFLGIFLYLNSYYLCVLIEVIRELIPYFSQ